MVRSYNDIDKIVERAYEITLSSPHEFWDFLSNALQNKYDDGYFDGEEDGGESATEATLMEVESLIINGDFDDVVKSRAAKIGLVDPKETFSYSVGSRVLQELHRANHQDGPFDWEFCGKCPQN